MQVLFAMRFASVAERACNAAFRELHSPAPGPSLRVQTKARGADGLSGGVSSFGRAAPPGGGGAYSVASDMAIFSGVMGIVI